MVLAILKYAAARITSLADAFLRPTDAPDSNTILGHLTSQLPSMDLLDRRVRERRSPTSPARSAAAGGRSPSTPP